MLEQMLQFVVHPNFDGGRKCVELFDTGIGRQQSRADAIVAPLFQVTGIRPRCQPCGARPTIWTEFRLLDKTCLAHSSIDKERVRFCQF